MPLPKLVAIVKFCKQIRIIAQISFYCLAKRKHGKPPKRKSNKHNGRKSATEKDNTDSEEDSDSDESLPENEEFPVVMDANSLDQPGKFYLNITKN